VGSAANSRAKATKTVTAADAKATLPSLLKRVSNGERITITHYNKPIADLVPPAATKSRAPEFGTMKGKMKILDPNWKRRPQTDEEVELWLTGKFD